MGVGSEKMILQSFSDDLDSLFSRYQPATTASEATIDKEVAAAQPETMTITTTAETPTTTTQSLIVGGIGAENTEKVREHASRIFKGEMEQTLTEAVNRVLTDYVARPYQQVCEDYADKSHMETQLFLDRVENVIKTTDPHM